MKRLFISILFLVQINLYSQTTDSTLSIEFDNLSKEYSLKFEKELYVFVNEINKQNLPKELVLQKINIGSIDNQGYISVVFQYNHSALFIDGSRYKEHQDYWSKIAGNGISIILQSSVFKALEEYKLKLSYKYYDTSFLKFINRVRFVKPNNDYLDVYSTNNFNSRSGLSREIVDLIVFTNNGKKYSAQSGNFKTFNQANYFVCKNQANLDGKKNEYYYFLAFFGLNKN